MLPKMLTCLFPSRCFAQLKERADSRSHLPSSHDVSSLTFVRVIAIANPHDTAYATVESDIFKPTKYGGKYTVTLIPGTTNNARPVDFQGFVMLTDKLHR